MMTMVLRDSIGGNCTTRMIATIHVKADHMCKCAVLCCARSERRFLRFSWLEESLSTMRFAKNVSMIKNDVTKNEQVDPGLVIRRLKTEISNLKAEIALLKGTDECKAPRFNW